MGGRPVKATPGIQPSSAQPEDGKQPVKERNAAPNGVSNNDSTPGQTNIVIPGPLGVVSNKLFTEVVQTTKLTEKAENPSTRVVQSARPVNSDQRTNEGFRHSSQERKNIVNGNYIKNGASTRRDILGTSTVPHRIKSAEDASSNTNYHLYVGMLAARTTCDDLSDNNINNVADVMNLNSRVRSREKSFCISLGDESSAVIMFNCSIWPSGAVVRPFRPARATRHGRSRGNQQSYYHREGNSRWNISYQRRSTERSRQSADIQ